MPPFFSQRGSTLVITLMAIVMLGIASVTISDLHSARVMGNAQLTSHDQAYFTAMAGMEYALMRAKNNEIFANQNFAGGSINYSDAGRTVSVEGTRFLASAEHALDMDGSGDSSFLIPNVPGNVGTGAPNNVDGPDEASLINLSLTNNNDDGSTITLDEIEITISIPGRELETIVINGDTVASYGGGMSLPGSANINNVVIGPDGTIDLSSIDFDGSLLGATATIRYVLSDGSTKTIGISNLQPVTGCFGINTADVGTGVPSGPNDHRCILNITVTNTCDYEVTLDKIYVWTSNNGKKLQKIVMDNAVVMNAGAAGANLPDTFDITDVTFAPGETIAVDYIEFNGNMRELDVELELIGDDGSSNSVTLPDLSEAN